MILKELANMLNGHEYLNELKDIDEKELKKDGVVVVFGYSDDNVEFRGAIDDEVGCYEGAVVYLNEEGLLKSECEDENCPHYRRRKEESRPIETIWDRDGYSWIYKTNIPHETFDIMEGNEKYCRGIVFYLKDAKKNI